MLFTYEFDVGDRDICHATIMTRGIMAKMAIGTIFSVAKSDGMVEGGTGEIYKKEQNQ